MRLRPCGQLEEAPRCGMGFLQPPCPLPGLCGLGRDQQTPVSSGLPPGQGRTHTRLLGARERKGACPGLCSSGRRALPVFGRFCQEDGSRHFPPAHAVPTAHPVAPSCPLFPLPAPGQPDGFQLLQLRSNSGSRLNHTPPSQPLPAPDPSGSLAAAWPTSDTSVSSKYLRNECVVASSRGGRESPARTPHGAGLPRTTQNVG